MSIVLTCGHRLSDFDDVHSILASAGVAAPKNSRRESLAATQLTDMILTASQIDPSDTSAIRQLNPGKVWQALTVDLLVANMNQPAWGWSHPESIYLLDFWRDFDPQISFCLVYSSPQLTAARLIATEKAGGNRLEQTMAQWLAYNSELLRFYHRTPGRSFLVNSEALHGSTRAFLAKCKAALKINLDPEAPLNRAIAPPGALPRLGASVLLNGSHDAEALYQELESAADLPQSSQRQDQASLARLAWDEYRDMLARAAQGAANIRELETRHDTLGRENELLLLQLHQVQEELEQTYLGAQTTKKALESEREALSRHKSQFAQLQTEKDATKAQLLAEISGLNAKADQSKKESEGLRVQARQLQEQLDQAALRERNAVSALEAEREKAKAQLAQAALRERNAVSALEAEREKAKAQLAQIGKLQAERDQVKPLSDDVAKLNAKFDSAQCENELLLLQLHQVQEELEHYFLKYQELNKSRAAEAETASAATAFVANANPSPTSQAAAEAAIDLRQFIDGDNWHEAEHDGRWAGPGTKSTLRLPALGRGRYRVQFEVVGAMESEILEKMQLRIGGRPVKIRRRSLAQFKGRLAPLKRAYVTTVGKNLVLPLQIFGSFDIDAERAGRPLDLELIFPKTISPSSMGEPDTRALAIRVRQITVAPR